MQRRISFTAAMPSSQTYTNSEKIKVQIHFCLALVSVLVLDRGVSEPEKNSSPSVNIMTYARTLLTCEFINRVICVFNHKLSLLLLNLNTKLKNHFACWLFRIVGVISFMWEFLNIGNVNL
jgi:hypothetical protein